MDFLNKINDWFETFRHAEGSLDFLWTFKVPKYAIIVDAKAGLLNRAIQIVLFVFVIVLPMSRGTGLEAIVPPLNQKLHIWLTGGDYSSEAGSGDANWYCDNPATDYYYSASFDYTNNKCRKPDFYADVSSKTPSGDFVFFNTYTEEVVDGPGGDTTERFFVTDVEKLKLNMYYMYDFAPRDQDKSLGYKAFRGRTDSKHQGPEHFQPVIRIFPSTDPQKPDEKVAYPLRTARDEDVIHTEDKGVDTHMTLADILNYANVSLDEPWELEKDDQDRSPLLRTTGVDIQMQVFVHARRWGVGNDRGPIYVDISFTYFPGWTSQGWVTMGRDDGVTTRQYQYGVGLTIKTEGEFAVFDPMVMIMYFVIQGAILGVASMLVLYVIGFCFAQKSLYLESYKDKVRPTASAAHFLMQALSAERIFRDVDDSGNGTVSPKELISFFRKHIGHGQEFWEEQQKKGTQNHRHRPMRVPFRPHREHAVLRVGEVINRPQRQPCGLNAGKHQKHEPHRRRQIGKNAVNKRHAMREADAAPEKQQPDMLHIALGPAPVTGKLVHQGGWRFFIAFV